VNEISTARQRLAAAFNRLMVGGGDNDFDSLVKDTMQQHRLMGLLGTRFPFAYIQESQGFFAVSWAPKSKVRVFVFQERDSWCLARVILPS
jgi:hypothetical protein